MANFSVCGDSDEDDIYSNTPFYIRYTRSSGRRRSTAASTSVPGHRTTAVEKEKPNAVKEEGHRNGDEVQHTEAGVESTPIADGKGVSKGPTGPVSMTLADPDLLDCPICVEPLCSPIYQCGNGHVACHKCCTTILKYKCSNCCLPIGDIRCRAVEQILESVRVTCQYMPYGCAEMFSYSKKVAHEKSCNYFPCSCPCCDFVGISKRMYGHFALTHMDSSKQFYFNESISISMGSSQKHVILRERIEGVLFILNRCIETPGSFLDVVCVAPPGSEKRWYELTVYIGEDSIRLKSSVEMTSKWTANIPAKTSLVVPSSTSQVLRLGLIIQNKAAPAS